MELKNNPYKIFGLDKIKLFVSFTLLGISSANMCAIYASAETFRNNIYSVHNKILNTEDVKEAEILLRDLKTTHSLLGIEKVEGQDSNTKDFSYPNFNHYLDKIDSLETRLSTQDSKQALEDLQDYLSSDERINSLISLYRHGGSYNDYILRFDILTTVIFTVGYYMLAAIIFYSIYLQARSLIFKTPKEIDPLFLFR